MRPIYHFARRLEFAQGARSGTYLPEGFEKDGFIHCSYAEQLQAVAESKFRGRQDLVLLQIDPSRVSSRIVDENLSGGGALFPHVYGPLPMKAVMSAREVSVPALAPFELPCGVDVLRSPG